MTTTTTTTTTTSSSSSSSSSVVDDDDDDDDVDDGDGVDGDDVDDGDVLQAFCSQQLDLVVVVSFGYVRNLVISGFILWNLALVLVRDRKRNIVCKQSLA